MAFADAARKPVIAGFMNDPIVKAAGGTSNLCLDMFFKTWSTNLSYLKFAITTSALRVALDAADAERPRAPSPGKRRGGRGVQDGRPGKRR